MATRRAPNAPLSSKFCGGQSTDHLTDTLRVGPSGRSLYWLLGLIVLLCSCSAPVLYVQSGGIRTSTPAKFLGVDFTHSTFFDPELSRADLFRSKIPKWNAKIILMSQELSWRFPIESEPTVSHDRNGQLEDGPFVSDPPDVLPTISSVSQEIRPYLRPGQSENGLLLVVERMNIRKSTAAHLVLFRLHDGEILLIARDVVGGDGFSTFYYHLHPLKKILQRARKSVNAAASP